MKIEDFNNLSNNQRNKIKRFSIFLSFILRHDSSDLKIKPIDKEGWFIVEDLLEGIKQHAPEKYRTFDFDILKFVVDTDGKDRYAFSDDFSLIRAQQGHSNPDIDIEFERYYPDHDVYHGTSPKFVESILENGLVAGSRHVVHLSKDIQTAKTVGKRHSGKEEPVILTVPKGSDVELFISGNGVILAKHIAPEFIKL